jgi:hypothetical protein
VSVATAISPTLIRARSPAPARADDERGERLGSRFRLTPSEPRQTREHGLGLLEPDIRDLAAVASVPTKRRPAEPSRIVDQEQGELERVGQAHEVKLGRRGESNRRVAGVKRATEAP